MNTNQNAANKKSGTSGWWMGGALMVAAALAITFTVRSAPAKPVAEPPSHVQSVPDAAANQRALDNLRALGANVPVQAHGAANDARALQDAVNQRELDHLRALGANVPQAVPDTANQRELDYLRSLGANIP